MGTVRPRDRMPATFALALLAILSLPVAAAAQDEGTGEVQPSEEGWGDEWFDKQAEKRGAEADKGKGKGKPGKTEPREGPDPAAGTATAPAKPPPPGPAKPPPPGPAKPPPGKDPKAEKTAAPGELDPALQKKAEAELARPIVAPEATYADLEVTWRARREALLKQDSKEAAGQETKLKELLRELDVPEVHSFAAAAIRESRKLQGVAAKEAVARAELAVALAPSLPAAHLQLSRAKFGVSIGDVGGYVPPVLQALRLVFGEQRSLRTVGADVAVALIVALLLAGAAVALLLFLRHGRYFLHDFHHVFPRGAHPLQTAFLAIILLSLPVVFRLGPFAFGATVVALTWLYLQRSERIVVGAWLLVLGLVPLALAQVARHTAWEGTNAELLYAVDRAGDFGQVPALEQEAARPDASPQTLYVLARAKKRTGDLAGARALYERAVEKRPRWAEAALNLGNVRFLSGELGEAERYFTQAIDASPGLGPAYFNLSRVHYRRVNFALGQETRAKAIELDRGLVARYSDDKEDQNPRANRYLLDVPLGAAEYLPEARLPDRAADLLAAQVTSRLIGPLPATYAPFLPLALVALLALLALAEGKVKPSRACSKCGRAVCKRCDPETAGGGLCGQCVNVFARKAVVDPASKVLKEIAVRRYETRRQAVLKGLAFILASQVVSGRVARGALFIFLAALVGALAMRPGGLVRPAYEGIPGAWKLVLLVPLLVVVYVLSLRDGLKGEEA